MNTFIIKIDPETHRFNTRSAVVSVLKKNGIIVYPTETFYGLGANCLSSEAVKKIYALKKRDPTKPLPVMISNRSMLNSVVAEIPPTAKPFLRLYWPGPLTLIFPANPLLPTELLGATKSIGVRLPAHAGLRDLVKKAGFPITATSANISGEEELSDPKKVFEVFAGKVDCIVDGGETKGGRPSTVVDLTPTKPQILREGAIPASELQEILDLS